MKEIEEQAVEGPATYQQLTKQSEFAAVDAFVSVGIDAINDPCIGTSQPVAGNHY